MSNKHVCPSVSLYRIRKKARYQELVDKEQLYDNIKAHVDLDEARINTVRTFIACRNKHLRSAAAVPQQQERDHHGCRKELDDDTAIVVDTTLSSSFTFDGIHGPQHRADDAMMIRMDMLEDSIRCKTLKTFGEDAVGNLEYRLVGGTNAIAVTRSGVVMVELSVVIKGNSKQQHNHQDDDDNKNDDVSIVSALVRWMFAPQSDKFTGMQWSTISDALTVPTASPFNHDLKSVESAKDLLGMQTCYPSVVSLDRGGGGGSGMDPQQQQQLLPPLSPGDSPGMNL
jgi:hypothetical protein